MALTTVIADTIAEFKGKLDALMAESLSKYRVPASGDYMDGYGAIDIPFLYGPSYGGSLPKWLVFPDSGVWAVHMVKIHRQYNPIAFLIDNYGNAHSCYFLVANPYWDGNPTCDLSKIVLGTDNYTYPLPNRLIDIIKVIFVERVQSGDVYTGSHHDPSVTMPGGPTKIQEILGTLKAAAKYAYEQAQYIATLEAELRALKAAAPPTEDLLGISTPTTPTTSPLAGAVIDAGESTPSPQLIVTETY